MLAYMDDILSPEEGQVIAKKIEDSEVATNLLHRTRDVMRRLRLGAPDIMDREKGLDPNTVAEYLDHMLPDERVADFEKVCLESEMHLAEVASCHQILALVLGEPAEVEPDSRQRMYHMPQVLAERLQAEATETSEPWAEGSPAYVGEIELPYGAKPPIPEYLRRSRRDRLVWPLSVAVVLLALLVALLASTGQFRPGTFLGDMLGLQSAGTDVSGDSGVSGETGIFDDTRFSDKEGVLDRSGSNSRPPEGSGAELLQPPSASIVLPGELAQGERDMVSPGGQEEPSAGPPLPPETVFAPDSPAEPVASPVHEGMPASPEESTGLPGNAANGPDAGNVASATLPAEPVLQNGRPVGVSAAADEILLRLEAGDRWHRLSGQDSLAAADRLLSLPTFRPSLLLADTIGLQLIDGTRLQLQPLDPRGVPGIVLETGRVVIKPTSGGPTILRIQIGEMTGLLRFDEADSVAAISASRSGEGRDGDPETQPAPLSATMFVTTGSCRWMREASPAPVAIRSPAQCTMTGPPDEVVPLTQIPGWIESGTADGPDRRASRIVEQAVAVDGSVRLRLKELAEDRQPEVRWLAIRCLGWVGDFDLLVAMLNDREQKRSWPDCFEQLRGAVMRSPATAARVRTEMERQHGGDGAALYEMLWGYRGGDELSQEHAARLIGYLEHKTLAFRVLGFLNLQERTGLGFFYRAEDPATSRQRAVQRWKERFHVGPFAQGDGLGGDLKPGVRTDLGPEDPDDGG
jgi:hypothetical protein